MTDFPSQLPHGEIREVLPDVFFVTGQTRPDALTLVNTMRLDAAGLARLDLFVLKIRPTWSFGASRERGQSLRCLAPGVSVMQTAHARQADDSGVRRRPMLCRPARR